MEFIFCGEDKRVHGFQRARGLLQLLVSMVHSDDGEMRKTALSLLSTLSANEVNNSERMGKEDLGLLRVLVSVDLSDDEKELENAFRI